MTRSLQSRTEDPVSRILCFFDTIIDDNINKDSSSKIKTGIKSAIKSARKRGRKIARRLRAWFPGAVYHIMHRGVRRKQIFEDETDYQMLLQILRTSLDKYNCILHAYCLMTNHIHLLIETGDVEIGKFMKYMSECYAMYINHKYCYRGHVFESRYKSCLVREDTYFLQTSRYIHLNPVKAQMVGHPEDYLWSSYRTMIGIVDDKITENHKTLAFFSNNSVFHYRKFVEDAGHKYIVEEQYIRKVIGEDELWLPW